MSTPRTIPTCSGRFAAAAASFGVVTAVEVGLLPIESVYAGHLWFPVERAAEVLRAWRDWTETVPEEVTSLGRILQFPPIPEIPEPMRGNSFAVVQAIYCGDDAAEMDALLEPLRALGPAMDTFRVMSMPELSHLHMDPEHPVPGAGDGGMLDVITDETIDVIVEEVVGKPILSTEIRHYGGVVARPRPRERCGLRVRGAVHHVRGRHRAEPADQGGGARDGAEPDDRARAVAVRATRTSTSRRAVATRGRSGRRRCTRG